MRSTSPPHPSSLDHPSLSVISFSLLLFLFAARVQPAILGTENLVNATIKAGTVKTLTLTSSMAAVFDLGDGFPKNFRTYSEKVSRV